MEIHCYLPYVSAGKEAAFLAFRHNLGLAVGISFLIHLEAQLEAWGIFISNVRLKNRISNTKAKRH